MEIIKASIVGISHENPALARGINLMNPMLPAYAAFMVSKILIISVVYIVIATTLLFLTLSPSNVMTIRTITKIGRASCRERVS